MAKLKDHIIKQEEHRIMVHEAIHKSIKENRRLTHVYNDTRHQPEEFLYKHNETMREWQAPKSIHRHNTMKHQPEKHQSTQTWSEEMPDLEGEALADAERQFDYDSWLGEHGIGE